MADRLTDEDLRSVVAVHANGEPDFWPEDRLIRLMATELLELRQARLQPMYVLEFEDRDPPGPNLIGPFPSREAAFAYADSLELNASAHLARPLSEPLQDSEQDYRCPACTRVIYPTTTTEENHA